MGQLQERPVPKTRTITVSIPAAIAERLDRLASLTERDISGLATDALAALVCWVGIN